MPVVAILALVTMNSCNSFGSGNSSYMAVQMEEDDGWSIIDEDGDIIVEDEYDTDDKVSQIYDKTYFVKSEGTYQLYSIDNPKKPLIDEEYTGATLMFDDRALVTTAGEPIQIINAEGEVIATLSKDIVSAKRGSNNTFLVTKTDGKSGWTDQNGNIIQEGFTSLYLGYMTISAVGKKSDDGKWLIYDSEGNKTGEFNSRYSVNGISGDYILVRDDDKPMLLDQKGEVVFKMKKASFIFTTQFQDEPICVFYDKSYKAGLANMDGEVLVRAKYENLIEMDNDLFFAKKGDNWGIIDLNEEKIVGFKFSNMIKIDDNILAQNDDESWRLIDRKGERIGKDSYNDVSIFTCDDAVYYINVGSQAKTIADAVKSFRQGETASKVGQRLNLTPSYDYRWSRSLSEKESVPLVDITTNYQFDSYVVRELTHQVQHNDGWWSYNETIHDGWEWSEASLSSIEITFDYTQSDASTAKESLIEALKNLGFKRGSFDDSLVKGSKQVTLSTYGSNVKANISSTN